MGRASVPTPALYPAFFFVLGKAAKAQETQSYQRFQCIGHTDFKGLSNAVTNTHPLLPSMGTTRQKNSCRNRLQNGPHSLLRMKVGTHSPLPTGSHTAAYTPKQGLFRMGALLLPSERFARFGNPARPGLKTANFAAFGSWPGALPKNAESLRDSDALMRVAVTRRRGPAGLRDPIAVSLTALIGFTVLADRDYRVRKKAHFVLCAELFCQLCLRLPPLCCTL